VLVERTQPIKGWENDAVSKKKSVDDTYKQLITGVNKKLKIPFNTLCKQ
jgi:hypothetical protein